MFKVRQWAGPVCWLTTRKIHCRHMGSGEWHTVTERASGGLTDQMVEDRGLSDACDRCISYMVDQED